MSRYIDADSAQCFLSKTACDQIERMPTADVREVRHGEWIEDFNDVICTVCREYFDMFGNDTDRFKYCPNCGAKMDKE